MAHRLEDPEVQRLASVVLVDVSDSERSSWEDPLARVELTPDEARLYGLKLIRAADEAEGSPWR